MADLTKSNKENVAARSLADFRAQALSHIAVLKAIKVNVAALKTQVAGDGDFDQAAEDSVQTVIDELLTEIATI